MAEQRTFERMTRETLEEHEQIHFFLDQLSRALRETAAAPADGEPMRRVAAELDALAERLREHFEREEEGGLFHAILDADDSSEGDLRHLEHQHARLLELLEMARIHAERDEPSDVAPLREDLEGFLAILRAHECVEEALFRRALGAVDGSASR